MAELRFLIDAPELAAITAALGQHRELLEAIMADLTQVRADFAAFRSEFEAFVGRVDDALEAIRAGDQAAADALAADVAAARERLAAVNPEDPSGDDPAPA